MTRKSRQISGEEATKLLGIEPEEFDQLLASKVIKQVNGNRKLYEWPKIKRLYVEHKNKLARKKDTRDDDQEWIKASDVAERICQQGCTKISVGIGAKEGWLTRDEKTKTYPWPKVRDEWLRHKEQIQTRMHKVDAADITISDEQVTDVFTTERLIKMIEEGIKGADSKAYQWARALNEIIKSRQGQLKLKEAEGKTVDIEEIEKWIYNISRQNREFWLQWPDRISVKMAEELGIDSRELCATLKKYVRQNLDRIATLPSGYESETVESSR